MMDIAVIGAGASGLAAAVYAARMGAGVTVYEKNDRIGKKLLATGNGRCNLTNMNITHDRYHGTNPEFIEKVLPAFTAEDAIEFFYSMGLITRVEDEGKVYPYAQRASAVLDVFRMEFEKLGIDLRCGFDVKEIIPRKAGFEIVSWDGRHEFASRVIFAPGGKAAPNLSGGSGYDIIKKLGHSVTSLRPSIVQIKTETEAISGLKGIKCQARVTMCGMSYEGELLFTDYGISGPPAFSLSSYYRDGAKVSIDFFPDIDEKRLYMILKEKSETLLRKEDLFTGVIHKNIASAIMKQAGGGSLKEICRWCKDFRLETKGTLSWNNAQVTKGGVSTKEINPDTMESLKFPGLYITGEILDVDGDCGGFNLQWAWTTGFLAGTHSAICEEEKI